MILFGDYHTHTKYSGHGHGKGTILENASVAVDKGLKQIAITDHGFNHMFYGVKRKQMSEAKEDILNAREITGIDILLGVEANLTSRNGDIDIEEGDYEYLDILLMGHHKMVKMENVKDFFALNMVNAISSPYKVSQERLNRNTTAFLRALDKHPIDVITHLNYGFPTDTLAVARLAKEKGVFVELNGKRINFTDRELNIMAEEGVKFIVNSDAHSSKRVGECNNAINTIFRLGLPIDQVVNVDKLPKFTNKRG
ncbi:MAG: PHP domain-containing protein [Clostridia bacterium]|nr:PHP domain-containing protein [Clostridia bacterium]MBQ8793057.1 PHP domain-containing protein [Clostridia bacterium]